jgi:hypothetical protein
VPRLVQEDGGVRILLPGDPGYDDTDGLDVPLPAGARLPGQDGGDVQGAPDGGAA